MGRRLGRMKTMGEAATTCVVSGLAIDPGEKVRAVLIQGSRATSGSEPAWIVRGPPIRCKFDGCGLAWMHPDDRETLSLWSMGMDAQRHRLRDVADIVDFMTTPSHRDAVDCALVRDDVWLAMLGMEHRDEFDRSLFLDDTRREVGKIWREVSRKALADRHQREGRVEVCRWHFDKSLGSPVASLFFNEDGAMNLVNHLALYLERGKKMSVPDRVLEAVVELAHVHAIASSCRVRWRPSQQLGPQFGQWEQHARFAQMIADAARARRCDAGTRE